MMGTSLPALMVLFIWFDRISEGAGLGCPSSPLCYRNSTGATHYICEWNMNTADKVKFMLYVDNKPHGTYDRSPVEIVDEALICRRPVNISVKVFDGNSSCTSPTTTVVLEKIVKFAAPRNVSLSWSEENLKMVWMLPKEPAEAEVLYRQHQNPAAEWKEVKHNSQCQLNAEADFVRQVADEPHWCQASFENFAKNLSYQVRLRHKSKKATQPLWSDWSPVMIVPAALTHEPEIDISREVEDDSRKVTIKWNPKQPVAAGVGGITYIVRETHGCPCEKEEVRNGTENYVTYVSKSSVYISVVTKNKAGSSPRAAKQIPLESTEHLKTCSGTLLQEKLRRKKCFELYQTQDGGLKQDNVITFTAKSKPMDKIMDYVRYLYFGYECVDDRPAIKTKCLIYKEQGVPRKEPPDFIGFSNSQTTANLSWREIPTVYQQGFVTHYHLCSVRIGSQDERRECHNVSAPQANISHQTILKYQMRNMTAGAKYNISVAGVTREGEGPPAGLVLQSQPEDKSVDVLLGIGLVLAFLFIVGVLVLFKRFRGRILPPVPKPVIFHFNPNQAGHQGLLVKKDEQQQQEEQVHEFTLHQNPPDETEMCFHATTETWGHTGSDMSDETSSNPEFTELNDPEEFGGDLVEAQFTSLLYKRGLVFDMKTDSDLYQSN